MYWPFLVDAINNNHQPHQHQHQVHHITSDPSSLSSSNSVTAFIRKGLSICVQRIHKNESGFHHRHHGTWLMLRSCTRSALVLLAAYRAGQRGRLRALLPGGWEAAVYKVIGMLAFWKDESRDCLDRWRILEGLMAGV